MCVRACARASLSAEWISSYHTLGGDIAAYNNPDWASGRPRAEESKLKSAERGKVKGECVSGCMFV